MRTNEKKVIFLNRVSSPYIEQAIFVLKENADCAKVSNGIVEEAERIVMEYAKEHLEKKARPKKNDLLSSENAFAISDEEADFDTPTYEFVQKTARWRFFSFMKRNFLKFLFVITLMAAIITFVYIASYIL